ncbi:MAG: pitrilysin family protein [Bacteroidales bacterium]
MPDRKIPPQNYIITHIPFIPPVKSSLSNGFPVFLLPGGTEDVVKIEWIFHAGSYYQKKPLISFSTLNLLKAGTAAKTSAQINEILDFHGAYLSLEAQKDLASVVVFVMNKNLDPVLELVQEIIRKPVFPQEELQILLNNQRQSFVVNNQKVQHLGRSYFMEAIFGGAHPYGYRLQEEDFGKITREDLVAFHQERIHGADGMCIVSGKVPPEMLEKLNRYFGDDQWVETAGNHSVKHAAGVPLQKKELLITREHAVQSAIRIGKRSVTRQDPDYHQLMIANALLGGFFGSRLMRNIRQEKGFTYGINSSIVSLVRDGYFFISTQVGVDVCKAAVDEIYLELRKLRTQPATDEELKVLKNYLAGNFLRSFDGPFAQGEKLKELVIFGLEAGHFDDFLKVLKDITPEQIMQTAEKHLHEDSMTEIVVGKMEQD